MRIIVAFLLALAGGAPALAQPANDACTSAATIAAIPFTATIDTSAATDDPADPLPSCSFGDVNTVWFTYTPTRDITLVLDTNGSDYRTNIAVFTGGCATPAEIACQDDDDFDGTTELLVPLAAGQPVLIFVTGTASGGNLVFHATKASVDATDPTSVRAIVAVGDPAPTGGGFGSIGRPVVLSRTDVAFTATTEGVFVNSGGITSTIAISGTPSPVGGVYQSLGRAAQSGNGMTVFFARIGGGSATQGIFVHSGGVTTPVVVQGDPAPGGGSFVNFQRGIAISPDGTKVAFAADTTLSGSEALYVAVLGVGVAGPLLTELVDSSPCGDVVRQIGAANPTFGIADDGEIGIWIRGTQKDAVLHFIGAWVAIACEGDPTPAGGTYRAFSRNPRISNGATKQVAFDSTITLPGPDSEAVFRESAFGVFVVAKRGDLTTGGETISNFPSNVVTDIDDSGTTSFLARTSIGNAVVTAPPNVAPSIVIASLAPCGTGVLGQIDAVVDADGAGDLAFRAACGDAQGILRIPAGGGSPVVLATLDDVTTVGPGFFFDDPSIGGTDVAFSGSRTGVYRIHCTSTTCDPVTTVAEPLTAVPTLAGEEIATINPDILAGQGNLIGFEATTRGGTIRRDALLASRSGTLELVAADGLAVPGTTAQFDSVIGSERSAVSTPIATDKRSIAFTAAISDPNDAVASAGVYLVRGGVTTEVARDGQAGPGGNPYTTFNAPLVKGARVYFLAELSLSPDNCFIRVAGTTHTSLACAGDVLDDPAGETLTTIETDLPGLGSRGPVFSGSFSGTSSGDCLFTATTSGATPVACSGALLPHGGTIDSSIAFQTFVIGASRKRVVALAGTPDLLSGVYEFSPRAVARLAANDEPTPIGGVYSLFDPRPSILGKTVAFLSDVLGGPTTSALFLATVKR